MIKGAIFDVDGTLVDSMDMWNNCGVNYLISRGITPEPGLGAKLLTFPIHVAGEYLKKNYHLEEPAAEVTDALNAIALDFYMNRAERKPYITELLDALYNAGVPMITATASDSAVVRRVLHRLGLERYFSGMYSCEELGWDKLHPECYLKCQAILDTDSETTWVFEDMVHSAHTARLAGLRVSGMYDRPNAENEVIMRSFCDRFLKTEEDFKRFIEDEIVN